MEFEELQQIKTETELPICVGSPLVGKKEKYIVDTFDVTITHTHINPTISKETRKAYNPEGIIKVGSVLHIVGTHKQMDCLLQKSF